MKAGFLTLGVVLSVTLMLLAFAVPVNHSSLSSTQQGVVLVADGVPGPPYPPPPPPPKGNQNLVPDRIPMAPLQNAMPATIDWASALA